MENKNKELSYPSISDKYVMANILRNADKELSKEVTAILGTIFECMAMTSSSDSEVWHSFAKRVSLLLKENFPEKFNE